MTVDLPALVYPTSATLVKPVRSLRLRWVVRSRSTTSSSRRSSAILFSIRRRSSSSFCSPAPLLDRRPLPPPWREREARMPTRRGSIYWSRADSTWSFASRVLAREAKICRMRPVRSRTSVSSSFSRLRICMGVSASLKITISASCSSISFFSSRTFPLPI